MNITLLSFRLTSLSFFRNILFFNKKSINFDSEKNFVTSPILGFALFLSEYKEVNLYDTKLYL